MTTIDELVNEVNALEAKMKNEGMNLIQIFFKDLFEKHPDVELFCWVQYTTYFNDGDPCVFSVYDLCAMKAEGLEEGDGEALWWEYDSYYWKSSEEYFYDPETNKSGYKKIEPRDPELAESMETFRKIPKHLFELIFGDHAHIIVRKDEIAIEEYEHD